VGTRVDGKAGDDPGLWVGSRGDGAVLLVQETLDFGRDLERRILRWEGWFPCSGLGAECGEALDREDLLVEDKAELAGDLVGQGFEGRNFLRGRDFARLHFVLQGRDGTVGDAAGVDEAKSRRSVVTLKANPWEVIRGRRGCRWRQFCVRRGVLRAAALWRSFLTGEDHTRRR